MPTDTDPQAPVSGRAESLPTAIGPAGIALVRPRRKHDRTKYPWRRQRLRRKVIQFTLMSSAAVLFLVGALYLLLSSPPPSEAGSSGVPSVARAPVSRA